MHSLEMNEAQSYLVMHTGFSVYFLASLFDASSLADTSTVARIGRQTVASFGCYLLSVLRWMVWMFTATLI
jgi:uncharacterized membrane protein YecN with MAPEG domain